MLRRIIPDFRVIPAHIDEEKHSCPDPTNTAAAIATHKAMAVAQKHPDDLVIAADTVVAVSANNRWLELAKPKDPDDAMRMLRILSGKTHKVITAVVIARQEILTAFAGETDVTFRQLSDKDIEDYVATGEPLDKAGAYGIQGGAWQFVEDLQGSLSNVIGLPMQALERHLYLLYR